MLSYREPDFPPNYFYVNILVHFIDKEEHFYVEIRVLRVIRSEKLVLKLKKCRKQAFLKLKRKVEYNSNQITFNCELQSW